MASSDTTPGAENESRPQARSIPKSEWPIDRKQAFQSLHSDYRQRAISMRRTGWIYMAVTFCLLGLAVAAVLSAQELARQDVELGSLKELRIKSIEVSEKIAEVEDKLNSLNYTDYLEVVTSDGRGIAVGRDGGVLSGENALKDWRHRISKTDVNINAVAIHENGEVAVFVGEKGKIGISRRLGRHWRARKMLQTREFHAVVFGKGHHKARALAVGNRGTIGVSTDNGQNWKPSAQGLVTDDLRAVTFVGRTGNAIAVGENGVIVGSTDGGDSWEIRERAVERGVKRKADLYAVESVGDEVVVAVGENGTVRTSTDGGTTWTTSSRIKRERRDFLDLALSENGRYGVAVGDDGLIAVSRNGYTKWTLLDQELTERFNAIGIDKSGDTAIAAGQDGTIIVGSDRGEVWAYVERKSLNEINSLAFADGVAVFVGENSTVLRGEFFGGHAASDIRMHVISSEFDVGEREKALKVQKESLEQHLKLIAEHEEKTKTEMEEMGSEFAEYIFFQTNALRIGILVVLMFLSQHLIVLARYNFRIAELYHGRGNVLMATIEAISWSSLSVKDFEQLIYAFSIEGIDIGRTPRSVMQMAMDMSRSIVQRRS